MAEAEVAETCVTKQGIPLQVKAIIAFKVGNDPESIVNAGQRFLSDQNQMSVLTGRIFAGHLRSIIGSMTVEEIITERQKLADRAGHLQGRDGQDRPAGGLAADPVDRRHEHRLHRRDGRAAQGRDPAAGPDRPGPGDQGRPRRAGAGRRGPSTPGRPPSCRPSTRRRSTRRRPRRPRPARCPRQRPAAGASRPRPSWPSARAELRQQQLVAEVVKPAEAEAERIRERAVAEAERMRIQAEAAASNGRVALDRMIIDQLPQIVAGGERPVRARTSTS